MKVPSDVEPEDHAGFVRRVDHVVLVGVIEQHVPSFLPGVLAAVHDDMTFMLFFWDLESKMISQNSL
jgi:hypothetical protein